MALRYYPFIDRALKIFNFQEKLSKVWIAGEDMFLKPFITVARDPGSGGAPIAHAVAEKLGYEFVDEQIVDEIAKSTQKRKAIIQAVDEKSRTQIEDVIHSVLNTEYIDDTTYITELVKIILTYAYRGKTVILGRGSTFITPFAKGLHVNITAPYKIRVQRAMDFEGHSLSRAKEVIADVEKQRRDFIKQYFRKDAMKAVSYDLTLNTHSFNVNQARDIIIEAFNQKFSTKFGRKKK